MHMPDIRSQRSSPWPLDRGHDTVAMPLWNATVAMALQRQGPIGYDRYRKGWIILSLDWDMLKQNIIALVSSDIKLSLQSQGWKC